MNTSKFTWPLRSLDSASFMVLNVVTSTLQLYFLAKLLTTGLVDVGDPVVDLQRGARSPGARPLLIGWLPA